MKQTGGADLRGRSADTPSAIPWKGLLDVAYRVYGAIIEDRVMLVAGGVTFYLLLAVFPAMTALVSLYGFVSDPATITERLASCARSCRPTDWRSSSSSCRRWPARSAVPSATAW
jgi:membrane protein